MATSDEIRVFAETHYVAPARQASASEIAIRAGDVRKQMRLLSRHPQVCSALGSKKFEGQCGIRQTKRTGPPQGSTTTFHYELSPSTSARMPVDAKLAVKSSPLAVNEDRQQRIVSIDELAKLRRSIVDTMNDVEGANHLWKAQDTAFRG